MSDPAAAVVQSTVPERTLATEDRPDEPGLRTLTTTEAPVLQQGTVDLADEDPAGLRRGP